MEIIGKYYAHVGVISETKQKQKYAHLGGNYAHVEISIQFNKSSKRPWQCHSLTVGIILVCFPGFNQELVPLSK